MAKENLEDISTEKLKKRKKFGLFIVGICIGVFIVNLVVMGILIAKGRLENISTLIPGFTLFVVIMPMAFGLKNINEELARRDDN